MQYGDYRLIDIFKSYVNLWAYKIKQRENSYQLIFYTPVNKSLQEKGKSFILPATTISIKIHPVLI